MKLAQMVAWFVMTLSALPICALETYDTYYANEEELKSLPAFCTWKTRADKASMERGFALLGDQFKNSHHFCGGMNFLNRYYRSSAPPEDKRKLLRGALDEYGYMITHLVPNSSLAAQSYIGRATAYKLLKMNEQAMQDYQQAVNHNPRLARAYIEWADFLVVRDQDKMALEVVTEGLRRVPNSPGLRDRYGRLGGKAPLP